MQDDLLNRPSALRPSFIRFAVVFVTFLSSVLLYLDRFCVNYAQQFVKEDLGLTDQQFGWCMSAFFFSYALFQVPSGWLTDRCGSRIMLTIYIAVWSFFTAAIGWVYGFGMLLLVRLAAGLGQAGAYPTAASVVGHWVPLLRRGLASSVVALGGRVGAAVGPILTTVLVIAFLPTDASVTLEDRDIFNVDAIALRVSAAQRSDGSAAGESEEVVARRAATREIAATFSSDARAGLQQIAAEAEPATDEAVRDQTDPLRRQTAADLVVALNALIDGPQIGADIDLRPLPIEREGQRLLAEETLDDVQRRRLNRFILEAVFPDGVRKIYAQGWRPTMITFGALGIIVGGLYFFVVRNRPAEHPAVNAAELALINEGRHATASDAAHQASVRGVPMWSILKSGSLWLLSISQFGTNIGWVFLVTWLPRYLLEVHQAPFELRGWLVSVPIVVGSFGMVFGGWLTDRLTARYGRLWGRRIPMAVSRFIAMGAFLLAMLNPSLMTAVILFAIVAFSTDLGSPSVWAFNQDVGGRYIASVLGWGNMWGNLGATVSPVLLEWIVRRYGGDWDAAFLTCAVAFLVSGLCGFSVDATKAIDPGE